MPEQQAEILFIEAKKQYLEKNIPEAVRLFSDLTVRFPEFGKACFYLGNIYLHFFEDEKSAEEYFKKAISLSPDYLATYFDYAELLLKQERFAEMNANLNKASTLQNKSKDKMNFLFGMLQEAQGNYDEAILNYRKAIASTFSDDDLLRFEKAILRCDKKKGFK